MAETREDIAFTISARDRASGQFRQVSQETRGYAEEVMGVLGPVALFNRRTRDMAVRLGQLRQRIGPAIGMVQRFGITLGANVLALGSLVPLLGAAATAYTIVRAAIPAEILARAQRLWEEHTRATRRARVQLQLLGLSFTDARAAIAALTANIDRLTARTLLQSTEAMSSAVDIGSDLSTRFADMAEKAKILLRLNPQRTFFALAEAQKGNLEPLKNLIGGHGDLKTEIEKAGGISNWFAGVMEDALGRGLDKTQQLELAESRLTDQTGRLIGPWQDFGKQVDLWATNARRQIVDWASDAQEAMGQLFLKDAPAALSNFGALLGFSFGTGGWFAEPIAAWRDFVIRSFREPIEELSSKLDSFVRTEFKKTFTERIPGLMKSAFTSVLDWFVEGFRRPLEFNMEDIILDLKEIWNGLKDFFRGRWIPDVINFFKTSFLNAFTTLGSQLQTKWEQIWNDLKWFFTAQWLPDILGFFRDLPGKIVGFFTGLGGRIAAAIGGIPSKLLGLLPGFQRGGIVPGPIGQPQLAVVHGGERIISNRQQQQPMIIQLVMDRKVIGEAAVDAVHRTAKLKSGMMLGTLGS